MILAIAGVNGAGKSSVLGEYLRSDGGVYFNPDEATKWLRDTHPKMSLDEANSLAWTLGYEQLKKSIDNNLDYAFETTLGGNSICNELIRAINLGVDVSILYCGLNSPELHIQRVAARVAKGGHHIEEEKIRERWESSIKNLEQLIPNCASVAVFDNSAELVNGKPSPVKLFALSGNDFIDEPIPDMPAWAIRCASVAIKRHLSSN